MKKMFTRSVLMIFLLSVVCQFYVKAEPQIDGKIRIDNLRCAFLKNPLGIDDVHPVLSWELSSGTRGTKQSAYEIVVADDSLSLKNNVGNIWSTGRKKINGLSQVVYQGKPLQSGMYYYWKVRVWDENGRVADWSPIQFWSVGLLSKKDWKAEWIGDRPLDSVTNQDKNLPPPSPLLRKKFAIRKPVRRAVLYATALGMYEMYLNGEKVGDHLLAPEWTDYSKRVMYQTYDVTAMIHSAENVIGAMLADGWYAGALWSHFYRGKYGYDRKLRAQLQIEYADGTTDTIVTDGDWKLLREGPIRSVSIFDGEVFDERLLPKGWLSGGFDDSGWQPVFVDQSVNIELNAQMNEPVKIVKEVTPVSFFKLTTGRGKYGLNHYVFDLGQNIAGWVKLSLPYNPGQKITIGYAEMLNEDSTLYTDNLRNAYPVDEFIPGKEASVVFQPRFTYHGFRYVEVTGLLEPPDLKSITGMVVASSSPVASRFESSDEELNKLWSNILWTQTDNMIGIPTDCPQRDERSGWMGDAQVFSQTAIYNMDMQAFYTKWFRDIRDGQTDDGRLPTYAPYVTEGLRYYDAPGWTDAAVIIPWKTYLNYGDKKVLEDNYPSMKKFVDRVFVMNPDLIRTNEIGQNYGDWLNGNTIKATDYPHDRGAVPKDLFNTAYFARSTEILAKISGVLKREKEYKHYDSLAKAIKKAFAKKYIHDDGTIEGDTQAGYAFALQFDLVPDVLKSKVVQHMIDAVRYYDSRISTGIHSTKRLMNQLSINGYPEVAYQLLQSHRFPSWFYSIDQGATTIWERWDGFVKGRGFQDPGMNSFNHYALGSVGEWFYEHILGIKADESRPGYQHFFIQPVPGGSLEWVKGNYHSVSGDIAVSWKKTNSGYQFELDIPANTTATFVLPTVKEVREDGVPVKKVRDIGSVKTNKGKTTIELVSGKYMFQY